YRSAVTARPGNIEARSSLGIALALSGHLEEAEKELEQCLVLAPCYFSAVNNLAQIQARRKAFDRAVDLYDRSLQCDPNNPMAHLGLGEIYDRALNNRQKAAMHYELFLSQVDPIHPAVQRIQARVLELTW
ncbi:MAG: tetratricopeptide repeat protein, partial [Myxococcota bacterium]|nr:tetratricopeptide repeat protein [Myxococcota bacterium]